MIDLDSQLADFDERCQFEYECCLQEMADERKAIIAEARRRLIAGFPLYGDQGWKWTPRRLKKERRQEWADGLVYRIMETSWL